MDQFSGAPSIKVLADTQPVAVAIIEAKAEALPPGHGLEQAKAYAACKRLNVPFAFLGNGHLFMEYDRYSGLTNSPRALSEFPTPPICVADTSNTLDSAFPTRPLARY